MGFLGGVAEQPVGLPLKGGQVIEGRGLLRPLLPFQQPHRGGRAQAGFAQLFRLRLGLDAPADRRQPRQLQLHGVELLLLEIIDCRFPLHQQGQRWGEHPAHVQRLSLVKRGKQPGAVNAHQPIRLGAAQGGGIEVVVIGAVQQVFKPLADGGLLHGGDPQPLHRLGTAAQVVDQSEDQLPLPARVGGAYHRVNPVIVHQSGQNVVLLPGVRQHPVLPFAGDDGQVGVGPLGIPGVVGVGRGQLHQMADTPAHQPAIPLKIAVPLVRGPQHLGDGSGHGRLFGDY